MPKSYLEKDSIHQDISVPWPWLTEYPNLLKVLRAQRFLFQYLILLLFVVLLWRTSPGASILTVCLLITSASYLSSWFGVKGEVTGAFWGIIYILCSLYCIKNIPINRIDWRWGLTSFLGVWAISTRPSYISAFAASNLFYLFYYWHETKNVLRTSLSFLFGLCAAVLSYCIINPNIFVAPIEAEWLRFYVTMGVYAWPQLHGWPRAEIFVHSLKDPIVALLLFASISNRQNLIKNIKLFGLPLFVSFLLLPSCLRCAWPTYYLPSTVFALLTCVLIIRNHSNLVESLYYRISIVMIMLGTLLYFFGHREPNINFGSLFDRGNKSSIEHHFESIGQTLKDKVGFAAIDRLMRAPILKQNKDNYLFFDSIEESPSELLRRLPSNINYIYVSCLHQNPELGLYSPAAYQWQSITNSLCQNPINLDAKSLLYWSRGFDTRNNYIRLDRSELSKVEHKILNSYNLANNRIYLRSMSGAGVLPDLWNEILYTIKPSLQLETTTYIPDKYSKLRLLVQSDCEDKTDITFTLKNIDSNQQTSSNGTVERNLKEASRNIVRRMISWSIRNYVNGRGDLMLTVDLPKSKKSSNIYNLSIHSKRSTNDQCFLILNDIQLE